MRNAFADELLSIAAQDERIVLLSGDIGNRLFNSYKERFPHRFYNCGVAEANMTGMAAGMALCGLRPVTYTIASFNTTRCLEQIRVDLCYHNLPVIIVGVGAGLAYAGLGATHHSCEDIAMLRSLPNMTIVCPGDAMEVRAALNAAVAWDGPVYLRMGKKNEPVVHPTVPDFQIGRGIMVCEGTQVCILSTGNMLPSAVEASVMLEEKGISTRVVSFHTVKPMDTQLLSRAFDAFQLIVTLEEHGTIGGLGGGVAEWLVDEKKQYGARLLRCGTQDVFMHRLGDQNHAHEISGLSPSQILERVIFELKDIEPEQRVTDHETWN